MLSFALCLYLYWSSEIDLRQRLCFLKDIGMGLVWGVNHRAENSLSADRDGDETLKAAGWGGHWGRGGVGIEVVTLTVSPSTVSIHDYVR